MPPLFCAEKKHSKERAKRTVKYRYQEKRKHTFEFVGGQPFNPILGLYFCRMQINDDVQSVASSKHAGSAGNCPTNTVTVKSSNPFTCCTAFLFGSSIIFFTVFVAFFFAFDQIRDMIVRHYTIISGPDSYLYDVWEDPAARGVRPLRKFTFFNMTNAEAVLMRGEAPNYEILGPYCYEESIKKYNIRFSADKTSVHYRYSNHFYFRPDCSKVDAKRYGPASTHPYGNASRALSEEDELIVPNMGIFGLRYRLGLVPGDMFSPTLNITLPKQSLCDLLGSFINSGPVGNTSLFIKVRVKDLLWGYPDTLWTLTHPALELLDYYASTHLMTEWNGTYPVPSPYTMRSGQLCPLYNNFTGGCNSTTTQDTVEYTGVDDYAKAGILSQWAGQKQLWWWGPAVDGWTGGVEMARKMPQIAYAEGAAAFPSPHGEECNINMGDGTSGMRWGPIDVVSKDKPLPAFADFCFRKLEFAFTGETKVSGIDAWRFALPASAMANTTHNKKCYQQEREGFFNFSHAVMGPVFAVKNWFLGAPYLDSEFNVTFNVPNADDDAGGVNRVPLREYINTYLEGTNAQAFSNRFESHIDVEPLTGTTVGAVVQGMAVTPLGKIEIGGCTMGGMQWASNIADTMVPLVILERHVSLPDDVADEIRLRLDQLAIAKAGMYVGIALGAAGILVMLFVVFGKPFLANKKKLYSSDKAATESLISVPSQSAE